MSNERTERPTNGILANVHRKQSGDFDLRDTFVDGSPIKRGGIDDVNCQIAYPPNTFFGPPVNSNHFNQHRSDNSFETTVNGTCAKGIIKGDTNSESAERNKQHLSTLLHGAFSTPLTSSPTKFLKRPPPSVFKTEPPKAEFDAFSSTSFHSKHQIGAFSSPPKKRPFFLQSQSCPTAFCSPSTSKEAHNSSLENDDPFVFKTVPILFMFDCSPIAPFFTKSYCFSNHFRCACLIIDGRRFICTEQYYMFYKARVFGDKRAMREIMATENAKQMKRIGANVEGFDQEKWYKIAIQVMVVASVKKFEQNYELRRQLFETSGADLIEVNPTDQRWSIGLGMGDWRIREKRMWKGLNWMGRLLTMLRDKLLERPEFFAEKQQLLNEISSSFAAADSVGCLQRIDGQKGETKDDDKVASSTDG